MPRNNLHSFTLSTDASKAVQTVKRGKKSKFVSGCIEWYTSFNCSDWTDEEGNLYRTGLRVNSKIIEQRIFQFVESHERLMQRYGEVCRERDQLKKTQSFISKMRNKFKK
jgi:hypothetical protein